MMMFVVVVLGVVIAVAIDPFCFEVWFRYLLLDEYVGCFDCAYVG